MNQNWQALLFNTADAGVSSAVSPELLPDNQNAWMLNGQNRGGKPSTRPNIAHRLDLPAGLLQGGEFFGVQDGMIVVSISGLIYKIRIGGNTFSYESIPLTYPNSPVIKQVWMAQTVEALVIQDAQSNPIVYDGSTTRRTTYGEVPRGRMMAYGNGRLWVAVDGNDVVAGDIRTGSPGSELFFTEATYLSGGGKLYFPSKITGLAFIPVTGQADYGALLVFSASMTNSIRADITSRDDWGKTPGFVSNILRSVGAASQWGIASVNQDLFWRDSNQGIRSIRNALADEVGPGSSPISREVSRLTDYDSQQLLGFSSSVYHDNRLLVTSSPFLMKNGGVGFKNLIALDFAPLSTMSGKSQAAYDGQWNGITFIKLVSGQFQGKNRAFALGIDNQGNNQLWEFGTGNRDDIGTVCPDGTADSIVSPIQSFIEYPLRDFGQPNNRKRLERFDLWLSELNGDVSVKVEWRADNNQKWITWDEASTCAKTTDASTTAPHVWKNLLPQYRPQFKTFTIPDNIIDLVGYAASVGFAFQIRLSWIGRCKIYKAMVHGSLLDDPDYADRTGFSADCVENDVNGNEIIYGIPNEGCPVIVTADVLLVGGGGGAGSSAGAAGGGGGGGGQFLPSTVVLDNTQSYPVAIGPGGVGGVNGVSIGTNGGDTTFGGLTAIGGGGCTDTVGSSGASGGGGLSYGSEAGGTGLAGTNGFDGSGYAGGGGGGAGGGQAPGNPNDRNGGPGLSSTISGTTKWYAAGGGAGTVGSGPGIGGSSIGGTGGDPAYSTPPHYNGYDPVANTGSGGGGGSYWGSTHTGGNGSSGAAGVLIVSYPGSQLFSGGAVTSSGGNTIHTFTSSGNLSPL